MANAIELARFEALVGRSGLGDKALAKLLDVDQSTVWRLRHGKIAKMKNYLDRLEAHLGTSTADEQPSEQSLVSDLVALSQHSPGLKQALVALYNIMHNRA